MMFRFDEINYWQNKSRLKTILEFRDQIDLYFQNSEGNWVSNTRIEQPEAKRARVNINRMNEKVHRIVRLSGTPTIIQYTPPPKVGGYIQNIDVISNIFSLYDYNIRPNIVYDMIDRAIGVYEDNKTRSLIRTLNPFFWISLLFKYMISLPFNLLGLLGFDQESIELSFIGRFVKGIFLIITYIASILTILHFLDFSESINFFLEIFNSKISSVL